MTITAQIRIEIMGMMPALFEGPLAVTLASPFIDMRIGSGDYAMLSIPVSDAAKLIVELSQAIALHYAVPA